MLALLILKVQDAHCTMAHRRNDTALHVDVLSNMLQLLVIRDIPDDSMATRIKNALIVTSLDVRRLQAGVEFLLKIGACVVFPVTGSHIFLLYTFRIDGNITSKRTHKVYGPASFGKFFVDVGGFREI
jgi:hypothetical protein